MHGLLKISLKLLINDRGKFITLIVGITFAVFLIMQMTSSFFGIMQRTASDIINIGAEIWVMDPSVQSAKDSIPIPNYVLDVAKSISGVKYAAGIYFSSGLVKLENGVYQSVSIIGLDDETLLGHPTIIEGNISAIFNNDAYIVVKDSEYVKLGTPHIGSTFEINDHRAIVVATAKVPIPGLFGIPTLYTTYSRATETLPTGRFTLSYVLLQPKNNSDINKIKEKICELGYAALTRQEFIDKNISYYIFRTGMGMNFFIMTMISFIVGLSIAGQTFYTFVIENLEKFGALKAIGTGKYYLVYMILFQAAIVGFLGYGIGVFLSSITIVLAKAYLANYAPIITFGNLLISFFLVLVIVIFSSYIGIRKVITIEPFDIFRG